MAHTSADAQAMLGAWCKSGKKFTIGYQNRFHPESQMLRKSCAEGVEILPNQMIKGAPHPSEEE